MNKATIIAAAVSLALATTGCTTMNQTTGKSETSTVQTAGLGAAIGAVAGGLLGGKKGALLGAAIGGAGGYIVALQMRQQELEEAQKVAAVIRQETAMTPVIYTKEYKDPQSGKSATGLERLEISAPVSETVRKGSLNPKAAGAYSKLNGMATQKDGNLVIAVPGSLPKSAIDDIQAAAPNAKIVTGSDRNKIVATLNPKSDSSMV